MGISKETMQAIIREYGGFELSDEELDLADVMSSRLLRVAEGGTEDA